MSNDVIFFKRNACDLQPQIIWGSYVRIVPLPPQLRLGGNLVKKIDKTRKILALIKTTS